MTVQCIHLRTTYVRSVECFLAVSEPACCSQPLIRACRPSSWSPPSRPHRLGWCCPAASSAGETAPENTNTIYQETYFQKRDHHMSVRAGLLAGKTASLAFFWFFSKFIQGPMEDPLAHPTRWWCKSAHVGHVTTVQQLRLRLALTLLYMRWTQSLSVLHNLSSRVQGLSFSCPPQLFLSRHKYKVVSLPSVIPKKIKKKQKKKNRAKLWFWGYKISFKSRPVKKMIIQEWIFFPTILLCSE